MTTRIFVILILGITSFKLNAQLEFITEDEKDIYWQPNVQLNFSDYQSSPDTACLKFNKKYGLKMCSSIGIRGVVDVPKRRGKKFDKFYLAPVFCKNCSCILSEDSLNLKVDKLLFDIAEVFARRARRELIELQNEMKADNTNTMFFTSIKNKWDEEMRSFFGTVLREVLIEKKDSSYLGWRQTVNETLQQTVSYATKSEDCFRFVSNRPLEKDYKVAKNIVGDLRRDSNKK